MPDILIRGVEPELKRLIEESARAHRRSLSDEVKATLRQGFVAAKAPHPVLGLATRIRNGIPADCRVEIELPPREAGREPPDFS